LALFRRGKHARRGKKSESLVTFTPALIEVLKTWDGSLRSFGTLYRELAPVRTVVDFLADAVATTSLKLHRRQGGSNPEERDHPAAKMMRRPNPEMTGMALIGGTIRDLAVYSVAYWRKIQTDGAKYVVPLAPEFVNPGPGNVLAPAWFDFFRAGGGPVRLQRDEVIYFRLYHPQDRRIGSSKLEALRPLLAEEIEVSRHRKNFWRNAARREGVIERPYAEAGQVLPEMSEGAWKRFSESWRGRTSGETNAGKTGFLEEGMHWVPDSFSPKEAEFIEGRKFILEATARTYNIPISLLGLTQTATFASQKEFNKALFQQTLPPWYQVIESELQLQLLPWFGEDSDGDLFFEFNVESKLRGSFEEQIEFLAKALGGGATPGFMTLREVRRFFNLPDIDEPRLDDLIVPLNVELVGPEAARQAPEVLRALPAAASRALTLKEALDRQQRSVLSKVGAGGEFDVGRWNRELAAVLTEWKDAG
jgi:HK97 family phage portal protein